MPLNYAHYPRGYQISRKHKIAYVFEMRYKKNKKQKNKQKRTQYKENRENDRLLVT